MTYQQYPPAGDPTGSMQGVVPQPGQPFPPAAPAGRRTGLIAVAAVLLAAGIIGGVVIIMAATSNYEDGVRNLARAPIGCTTSLEFDEAGTYTIYVETTGEIGDLRGDCPNADTDYDLGGDDLPDVDIVLVDDDGDEVDTERDSSTDYDAGGFVGTAVATVEIDDPGDYELTATSDEDEIAVAVGRDPKGDSDTLRMAGVLTLALGVVVGGLLLVLGLRRRPGSPNGGSPAVAAPQMPSMQMPYGAPPQGQYTGPQPVVPPAPQPSYQPPTMPMPPTPPAPPPSGGWPAPPSA